MTPPAALNLATHFLDSNVHEGRGERVALTGPRRPLHLLGARGPHQPGGQCAPRSRRPRSAARPPRARRLGRVRRHLVRGAEDRRGHRRGVHVPAAEGLRVLPRLHGRVGRGRRRPHPRADARSSGCEQAAPDAPGRQRRGRDPPRGRGALRCPDLMSASRARSRTDLCGHHCALEVHHREHWEAQSLRAHGAEPGGQPRGLRARCARHSRRGCRAPGSQAVLRLRSRPRRAFSLRRGRLGGHLRRALDTRAHLRVDRPAPADHPRQRPDDDAGDARPPERGGPGPELPSPLHVRRRGAPRTPASPLERRVRRRGARRDRLVRGVSHLHLQSTRPDAAGEHR